MRSLTRGQWRPKEFFMIAFLARVPRLAGQYSVFPSGLGAQGISFVPNIRIDLSSIVVEPFPLRLAFFHCGYKEAWVQANRW